MTFPVYPGLREDAYLDFMDQYRPCYRAHGNPLFGRSVTGGESLEAVHLAEGLGLSCLDERWAWALL